MPRLQLAPPGWRVVQSRHAQDNGTSMDEEVWALLAEYDEAAWKVALTTTEFLTHPDLHALVEELEADLCREAGELGTRLGAVERERGALERSLREERGMREKVGVGMCLTWAGRGIGGRNEIEGRRNEISGSNLALGGDVGGV